MLQILHSQQVSTRLIIKMLKRKFAFTKKTSLQVDLTSNTPTPPKTPKINPSNEFSEAFLEIQKSLNEALRPVSFSPPVSYIYNPVEYAWAPNAHYVRKFLTSTKKVLFVGMNPGPFGMCQTGVPFGEIKAVRDWLKIEGAVEKPERECAKRPVEGFACKRSEVSGDRLWGVIKELSVQPEVFFKKCFVYNYCPLALLKNDGGNLTPSDIKDRKRLEEICDSYFLKIIELLSPEIIVGIGRYAEQRALITLKNSDKNIRVLCLVHPSPRVKNNQNWAEKAKDFFTTHDLLKYMTDGQNQP